MKLIDNMSDFITAQQLREKCPNFKNKAIFALD